MLSRSIRMLLAAAGIALAATLAPGSPIRAAMSLLPVPADPQVGEQVTIRPAWPLVELGGTRIPVFLAAADAIGGSTNDPPPLVPLGELPVDSTGAAELRVAVPDVPPGTYTLVVDMRPSNPGYWPAGTLTVTARQQVSLLLPRILLGAGILIAIGAGSALVFTRMTRRPSSQHG